MTNQSPPPKSVFAPTLAAQLDKLGSRRELPCNDTAILTGLGEVWFVEDGKIDIFAAERNEHGHLGSRRHLATISAPGLVCGLNLPDDPDRRLDIVAVSRGGRAMVVEGAAIGTTPPLPVVPPLARAVDGWIEAMTAGLVQDLAPRTAPSLPVAAGDEGTLAETGIVAALKGVVWISTDGGDAKFLGMEAVDAALPLTPDSWLTGPAGLRASGIVTDSILRGGEWWKRQGVFNQMYFLCLQAILDKRRLTEIRRLDKRATDVADGIDGTLFNFARLVGEVERPIQQHDPDNALAIACSIACKPLGISIEASPKLNRRRQDDRPLSVAEIARTARVRCRHVALRGEWWRQDNGPMVAYSDEDGRPFALVPNSASTYVAHDPMRGGKFPVTAELAATFSPMAWTFYAPLPDGKVSLRDLVRLGLQRQTADLAFALLAGALGGALGLAIPIATGLAFKHVIPGHQSNQLVQLGLALVMAAAGTTIFKIVGDVALLRIEGRVAGRLQAGIIDRLLRLPTAFFSTYSTGDLAQRTLTVEVLRRSVTGLVLSSLLAGVFSLFSFGLLFWFQPFAALAVGALFLVVLGAAVYTGFRQMTAITEGEQLAGNINSLVLQIVGAVPKLRMAGAENRAFVLWGKIFSEMRRRVVVSRSIANSYAVFMSGWDMLALAAVFAVMALASGEDLETGTFLAFVAAFSMFMASISQVARAVMQCFMVAPMVKRAEPLLSAIPESDANKADPGLLTGNIEINGVYFRYDRDSPRVLNGLAMDIKPGQFVALVGPSGCGKSTLMRLLLGFERAESGGIFYDGRDLRTLDILAVRRQIGVVLQTGRLMPGSLYENIKGATDGTVDDAWEAARKAGLAGDIEAMPMGMHTVLTEGSAALSGGQVQRLLIARALISKPRVIFFDEATSALDNRTQAVVTESLSRLSVTRIAIAHRLSTVRDADKIFVLNEGKVAEAGDFDELMGKNGMFASLARRQLS